MDAVVVYHLNASEGQLTPQAEVKVPGGAQGPRHLKFSPDGRFAYVLNELSLNLARFAIDPSNGSLRYLESTPLFDDSIAPEGMSAAEIRVHPDGTKLYTSTRDLTQAQRDLLSTFTLHADGSIERIAQTPAAVSIPRNFNVDPSGQWLVVGGQRSRDLAVFRIHPETGIPELSQSGIAFDGEPICFEWAHIQ